MRTTDTLAAKTGDSKLKTPRLRTFSEVSNVSLVILSPSMMRRIMSPLKTLFNYGFRQSQSPASTKDVEVQSGTISVADDELKHSPGNKHKPSSNSPSIPRIDTLNSPNPITLKGIGLALVPIDQVDISLHALCEFIYKPLVSRSPPSECYIVEEGMILGRQSKAPTDHSVTPMRTIHLGIPADENLISREHVHIVSIVRIDCKRDLTLPSDTGIFSSESKDQLISSLHMAQNRLPKMGIRVNHGAKNYIRVHKRRVDSNLSSTQQNWEKLHKDNESLLAVGDVIVFDASTKSRKKEYRYRLVAVEYSSLQDNSNPSLHESVEKRSYTTASTTKNVTPKKVGALISSPSTGKKSKVGHGERVPLTQSSASKDVTPKNGGSLKVGHGEVPSTQSSEGTLSYQRKKRIIVEEFDINVPSPRTRTSTVDQIDLSTETEIPSLNKVDVGNVRNDLEAVYETKNENDSNLSTLVIDRGSSQYKPVIGDRFRVLFSVDDCFGRKVDVWHFATVLSVRKKRLHVYNLSLQFDDKTTDTMDYPSDDIERLIEKHGDDQSSSSLIYALSKEGDVIQIAYHSDPKELFIGDLVLCHYQNGEGWHYGRVAATHNQRKTVDVAYFDGDYEEKVPLATGNFYLIERGNDNLKWLVGLTVPSSLFTLSTDESTSTIVMNGLQIGLMNEFGQMQNLSYEDLLRVIFKHHRANVSKKNRLKRWPSNIETPQCPRVPKIYSKSTARFEEQKWIKADSDVDDDSSESDMSMNSRKDNGLTSIVSEIRPTNFANQLWRSINSSQPHDGHSFLFHFATVLNQGPTDSLANNLQNFTIEGPKTDGVKIRDPHKIDLVYNYINHMNEHYLRCGISPRIHPRSWEEIQSILILPSTYDHHIPNENALRRLYSALQFSHRTIEFLSNLILNELKEATGEKRLSTVKKIYRSKTMVDHAVKNGIRESLKSSLRSYVKVWIEYELFRHSSSFGTWHTWHSTDFDCCLNEYEGCIKNIGAIVSCLAFVFCAENGLGLGCDECCYLFRDIVQSEIRNSSLNFHEDKSIGLNKEDDFIFRVILSLKTMFSFPFQVKLASMFHLSGAFAIVFDALKL